MNYVLQVVRGRSDATTLKLMDGVNSIGRHDDCLIRIRSSQVSRRHCELFEDKGKLMVKDLGSSNGTFVNGKRVLGQQILKPGDVLIIGGVTLRVDLAGGPGVQVEKPSAAPAPKPGDTAEVDAIALEDDDLGLEEEFVVELDDEVEHMDVIPLDDEPPSAQSPKPAKPAVQSPPPVASPNRTKTSEEPTEVSEPSSKTSGTPEEEEAVAQFLMDLKLDDED
jgi:pSer/pThr/pTyr-binding forkhead associated (FHA) protein